MTVRDILNAKGSATVHVKPEESVAVLARRLVSEHIGAAVVSRDGRRIEGIVSERDLLRGLAASRDVIADLPVSEFMTDAVETCGPNDNVEAVMRRMLVRHLRHMPVIERKGCVGIVTLADLVKFHLSIS